MMQPNIAQALMALVERLGPAEQRQVLDFARALHGRGSRDATGKGILLLTGAFDPADLAEMASAIEESCERVDLRR